MYLMFQTDQCKPAEISAYFLVWNTKENLFKIIFRH